MGAKLTEGGPNAVGTFVARARVTKMTFTGYGSRVPPSNATQQQVGATADIAGTSAIGVLVASEMG